MRTLDYIFIIIIILIILYLSFNIKNYETFDTSSNISILSNLSPHIIAIKNLSGLATKLISGSLTIPGNLHISGDLIVDKSATITGLTTMNSSLNINGTSNLLGALNVPSNLVSLYILNVSGDSTLNGNLKVSSKSYFNRGVDNLVVNGDAIINSLGKTTLNGPVNINSNLNINGDTTLGTIFLSNIYPKRNLKMANKELIKIMNNNNYLFFTDISNNPNNIHFCMKDYENTGFKTIDSWHNNFYKS